MKLIPDTALFKSVRPILYLLIQSYFSLWALMRTGGITTRNILTLVLFALLFLFYRFAGKQREKEVAGEGCNFKKIRPAAFCLAALFTLFTVLASGSAWAQDLSSGLFRLAISTACGIGYFFLYFRSLELLLGCTLTYRLREELKPIKHLPPAAFFTCLLFWLPYFLYEYPGIMSPDSINQVEQVLGMVPYSNHHPWVHTLLIGFFNSLGSFFTDDITVSISFFTLFQLCFMAFCVSYLIATLQKLRISNLVCLAVLAFYALVPYHAVFAVTLWKDVLFSGCTLLFTLTLVRLLLLTKEDSPRTLFSTLFLYLLSGFFFCLLRSNGWYAFLFTLPFLLFSFRRRLKLMLPLHLAILAAVLIVKDPVMTAFQVSSPDFVESICIPLQQVSRVIVKDRVLTQEENTLIHNVIDTTYIKELYAPGFADNMKELVRAGHPEYLEAHKADFLKLWLSLGLRYPADYIGAYVDQTRGYWYPDTDYRAADIDGVIENDTGITSRPLLAGKFVVKIKEIFLKLGDMLPLYGLLWSMGAMLWATLISMGSLFTQRRFRLLILYMPGLAVILTILLATPVAAEFRYAYSLTFALPLYLLLPLSNAHPSNLPTPQ